MRAAVCSDRLQGVIVTLGRFGLGVLLLASVIGKINYPTDFLMAVYGYELVGSRLGLAAAILVMGLELTLGVCLIFGLALGGALLTTGLMLMGFAGVQASAWMAGAVIPCGCGLSAGETVSAWTIARAGGLGLAACGVLVVWWLKNPAALVSRPTDDHRSRVIGAA